MTEPTYTSAYDRRLKMVQDVLTSRTDLGGEVPKDLAAQVLRALDHIPEKVR
ncbi:DUF6307 family protein [Lentzea sp. HUAS TT2]|uniref:DUF6307 family protein n=1 Tax=Lentzea sp. HUAS TT2 TaxID=3447454 RepID=UPI003F7073FF